jgi:hypothetical protein
MVVKGGVSGEGRGCERVERDAMEEDVDEAVDDVTDARS